MWDVKLKLIDTHTQQHGGYPREGGRRLAKGKGAIYLVTEDDLTWGGGYTMQHTDHVS